MSEITLSIIISTYNRSALLKRNLERMLKCELDEIEFIVGDNASEDNTWEVIQQVRDSRVVKVQNERNYGFDNFWLLSFLANGKYFMFVNDRDFVKDEDIKYLCRTLNEIEPVDFVSNEKRAYAVGYYTWKDALDIYFQSRHPGTIIYNTKFCHKYLRKEKIKWYLSNERPEKAYDYLAFQLLLHVEKVYVFQKNVINQPFNREKIPQVRKEYYSSTFISVEYRIKDFYDWAAYSKKYISNERTRFILLAVFKDSIMTVTWEYYMSMRIPGFAKRVNYQNHTSREWLKNGLIFWGIIFFEPQFQVFKLHREINKIFINNFKSTMRKVLE